MIELAIIIFLLLLVLICFGEEYYGIGVILMILTVGMGIIFDLTVFALVGAAVIVIGDAIFPKDF